MGGRGRNSRHWPCLWPPRAWLQGTRGSTTPASARATQRPPRAAMALPPGEDSRGVRGPLSGGPAGHERGPVGGSYGHAGPHPQPRPGTWSSLQFFPHIRDGKAAWPGLGTAPWTARAQRPDVLASTETRKSTPELQHRSDKACRGVGGGDRPRAWGQEGRCEGSLLPHSSGGRRVGRWAR